MTQEEKELLIKDLCGRLPYGVQGITEDGIVSPLITKGEADWDILTSLNYRIVKHGWKPYLRSMSSMTEEEQKEFVGFHCVKLCPIVIGEMLTLENETRMFDWLNAHHFDYRGLIPMGFAIEAPKDMYNTKTE